MNMRKTRAAHRISSSVSSWPKKFIVVALPFISEREIPLIQGIKSSLAHSETPEILILHGGYESALRELASKNQLAGAIGEFISDRWLEAFRSLKIPIIQLGNEANTQSVVVSPDIAQIARDAAATFSHAGILTCAYAGSANSIGSIHDAFSMECTHRGMAFHHCTAITKNLVRDFLKSLPKRSGILCVSDRLARIVILCAKEIGRKVPEELAVIGIGNSPMDSLHAGMEISSFELPLEEIGRAAGRMMSIMLKSPASIISPHTTLPCTLHERTSSIQSTSGVAKALAYLRSHPNTNLNAGELARLAGMSRRSFENAIKLTTGVSPGELLKNTRQMRAEKMLQETDIPIGEISVACGFQETSVFSCAFKRWTGQSPREFRGSVTRNEKTVLSISPSQSRPACERTKRPSIKSAKRTGRS